MYICSSLCMLTHIYIHILLSHSLVLANADDSNEPQLELVLKASNKPSDDEIISTAIIHNGEGLFL